MHRLLQEKKLIEQEVLSVNSRAEEAQKQKEALQIASQMEQERLRREVGQSFCREV